jgi:hypothetical protein
VISKVEVAQRFRAVMEHFAKGAPGPQYLKNRLLEAVWPLLEQAWEEGFSAGQSADYRDCNCDPGEDETEDWCSCWPNPYKVAR